ncbi:squamosa promoter-binding-like protein 14 [Mangifera indica]|uniref:squamosa promoter-binding-like protein 14 n=1 Tax=Mangifera indica TaxID=29780 RepID=UPI001CFBD818|nr:squamosa promoter-binding-like protein 14 [Mangifera indica]XP_044475151.1 squamosa promoter-binding-like protein 14 [Mangifera indica]
MEEVGAQMAPSIFMHHQALSSRLCEPTSMAKKRHLSYQGSNFHHQYESQQQQRIDNWNPKLWDWDSVRFVANPRDSSSEALRLGASVASASAPEVNKVTVEKKNSVSAVNVDDGRLDLNLAGCLNRVEEPVSRPNKRVRSGSPGSTSYPMCQVDDCKEDLSNAKDYHRRHKVCEFHSKSSKALVGKQMQRFCQQCSRFHPLSEFDEGKRSCRRRLAGHNRRRRKTQPDDVTSRPLIPPDQNNVNPASGNLDIFNLLATVARAQGKTEDKSINCSSVPDRDRLIMILSKINSLPLPADLAAKLANIGNLNWKNPEQPSSDFQNRLNGNTSSPSTMDLLAVLSATLATSAPDALTILSQRSSHGSDSEKTKLACLNQETPNFHKRTTLEFPSVQGERSGASYQSHIEDSDCQIQETQANLPLQLFSSSPEDDSPPKLSSSRKYFSSESSNPTGERSPSSSPVVQKLFPMQSTTETVKSQKKSVTREANANVEVSQTCGSVMPLDLFRGSNRGTDHCSFQSFPCQTGCTSSSGSDQSPSSLNSDAQDRTGRIIFKLFDKDPSHLPRTLQTQIYNWLSNSPSEMESYIRPGCVVLSIYVSMSSAAWEQFEGNLLQHVNALVQDSDSNFWKNARFLVHTGRQLASHKAGKIRLCKSWRTWSSPELISVSPLAVVVGQENSFILRGRNLTSPGTKIHCTYMGGYTSHEVTGSTYLGTMYDEIKLDGLKFGDASPGVIGRFFVEVENGFKGNSFPVIIADATICKELRLLESEFETEAKVCDIISEDQAHEYDRPRSREETVHFLNELGWLFQRKRTSSVHEGPDYSLTRFKFLLVFSVEHDCCALVKAVLDMMVERSFDADDLSRESLDMLTEIQLLSRAVKRRCRGMTDLLIRYSIGSSNGTRIYIFPPDLAGPGGITPLHLAACTADSDDMIDALTNDPQEIGLSCWNTLLDANGLSPNCYAIMRNNHSYNKLVERKLSERRNGHVSVSIGMEIEQSGLTVDHVHRITSQSRKGQKSCARCAMVATKVNRRVPGTQGLLHRPYIHSMLAIAAVCVCVCLFLRGSPDIGLDLPFTWENLNYGPK